MCGKGKLKKKEEQKKDKERAKIKAKLDKEEEIREEKIRKENPFEGLPEDSKFGLQRMLEMAKDDPLHYMEEPAKLRIHAARKDLRCDVCHAILEDVHHQVLKLGDFL